MRQYDRLDDKNFLAFAAVNYDNPSCYDEEEFFEDLKRIKYIKKALTRFETTGELKDRLIMNHLIILYNVFGPAALSRILCLKMEKQMPYLKPFLQIMGVLPKVVKGIGKEGKDIRTEEIESDARIVEALKNL